MGGVEPLSSLVTRQNDSLFYAFATSYFYFSFFLNNPIEKNKKISDHNLSLRNYSKRK